MRTLVAIAICCAPLPAQTPPDAASILERQGALFQTSRTLQYTQTMEVDMNLPGNATTQSTKVLFQFAQPNRIRMEANSGGIGNIIVVADGQTTWEYMPTLKQYSRRPEATSLAEMIGQTNPFLAIAPTPAPTAKAARSEVIDIDGRPHDCWVIEQTIDQIATLTGGTVTIWIDKQLNLALRSVIRTKMEIPGAGSGDMTMTSTIHDLVINPVLADSLFVFTPPEDATEVPASMIGRIDATPVAPPLQQPIDPAVQAFVPDLHPIERIEPEYPAAAKQAKKQGDVEILLTLDPSGAVIDTAVLAGDEVFRQSALDAVKQWRYRPVLRDGCPVTAYATAFVSFFDPDDPGAAPAFDLVTGDTAASRTMALMTRFPRTPQQVLEDLEQDLGPPNGPDRQWVLPQLAKAALAAGEFEKAAAYANDMLKFDPASPNYGQLVHDGHAIQGLIALRQGNIPLAARDLLEAGRTSGSPVLNSFGPNMTLAKELLEKGEKDAVLEYFELCRKF